MDILSELSGISGHDQIVFAVLALLDATSAGTLAIPVVLLLLSGSSGRLPARAAALRVLAYLVLLAAFYWLLGAALLAGLQALLVPIGEMLEHRAAAVILVAVGAGLAWLSWWLDPEVMRRRGADPQAAMQRWIDRAQRVIGSWRGVAGLALTAGLVEAATMVPYLAAIAGMGRYELGPSSSGILLGLYCLVMVLPALLLVLARLGLGDRGGGVMRRVRDLAVRSAPEAVAWGLGIVGVLLILRGLGRLL